jgi:hypothetical protein
VGYGYGIMPVARTPRHQPRRAPADPPALRVRIVTVSGEEGAAVRRAQVEAIREVLRWLQSQCREADTG